MKKTAIGILLFFFCITAFAQKQFVVDANAEMRSVSGTFNAIKVSGGIDIYLSQSDNQAVAVSASDEKYIPNIKTVVENNTLKIYYEGDKGWSKNRKMMVYVAVPDINNIEASGASDIIVAGTIKTATLKLILSGASDFKGDVSLTSLKLYLSGASDVHISGTATNLDIESSGASDVKGFDLVSELCTAKASGASDINVTVRKELTAHASGASNIYYQGTAVIKDMHSSGASTVAKKG
jgi:hypothetical protein